MELGRFQLATKNENDLSHKNNENEEVGLWIQM